MKEHSKDRGQLSPQAVVLIVVGLAVGAIVMAFILPVAIGEIEGASNTTANQTVGEDIELTGQLNSTLTGVTSGTPDTATFNVTIYDNSSTRESAIVTVDESDTSTSTATLDGNDIVINATEVETGADAYSVAEYQYPRDAGWGSGASSIWGLLGLAIVLGIMIFFIGIALSVQNRM